MHVFEHFFATRRLDIELSQSSIVKVGQHHKISGGTQSTGHIMQLFTLARGIHQENHNWMWSILFGMCDKRIHHAIFGADVYISINHKLLSFFNFHIAHDHQRRLFVDPNLVKHVVGALPIQFSFDDGINIFIVKKKLTQNSMNFDLSFSSTDASTSSRKPNMKLPAFQTTILKQFRPTPI